MTFRQEMTIRFGVAGILIGTALVATRDAWACLIAMVVILAAWLLIMHELGKPDRIRQFWDGLSVWSQATFGTDSERGCIGPLKHLEKEAREAQQDPDDLEEKADCLFLVFDATRRSGRTLDELLAACEAKLEKNRARQWNKPTSDEPVEHLR